MTTRIYAAMEGGLLVLSRRNGGWDTALRLEGAWPVCLAIDPSRSGRMYCGTFDRGLWRTTDAGETWEPVGEGVSGAAVTAVAVSATEQAGGYGVVYAGTEPSALYRSEDGGETWRELEQMRLLPSSREWSFPPRPETSHVRAISLDPNAQGKVYAAIEAGALVRSFDGGETWEDRVPDAPRDTHTLLTHQAAPGRVYSAAGDGIMQRGMGYSESPDGGDTWRRYSEGLSRHYLWGMAVDPADPETVVVSAARGPREAHDPGAANSTVFRREAGGPWEEVTGGLPEQEGRIASVLAANEGEPGVFYALTNMGLYRSPDAGFSWEHLEISWPDRYRRQHPWALVVAGAG